MKKLASVCLWTRRAFAVSVLGIGSFIALALLASTLGLSPWWTAVVACCGTVWAIVESADIVVALLDKLDPI